MSSASLLTMSASASCARTARTTSRNGRIPLMSFWSMRSIRSELPRPGHLEFLFPSGKTAVATRCHGDELLGSAQPLQHTHRANQSGVWRQYLLVPGSADDNLLLFAFRRRIPLPTTAKYESRAQRLQSRLTLEFPRYLRRICQGHVLT